MPMIDQYVQAWAHSFEAVIELGQALTEDDWNRPTDCPGWTVKDQYAHLVSIEAIYLGEPVPEHELPELAHVRTDADRAIEIPIDLRRSRSGPEVLAELAEVYARRRQALDGPLDPAAQTTDPWGRPRPLEFMMMLRSFDAWIHEQDIRRAVGRPGNLSSPGAQLGRGLLLAALPKVVAKDAGAAPGTVVRFAVTGPVAFVADVAVDADGRGAVLDDSRASAGPTSADADPTVTLRLGWETFIRLGAGRVAPETAAVELVGDEKLGRRVLDHLAVTP